MAAKSTNINLFYLNQLEMTLSFLLKNARSLTYTNQCNKINKRRWGAFAPPLFYLTQMGQLRIVPPQKKMNIVTTVSRNEI
jgi:hypothetical protein